MVLSAWVTCDPRIVNKTRIERTKTSWKWIKNPRVHSHRLWLANALPSTRLTLRQGANENYEKKSPIDKFNNFNCHNICLHTSRRATSNTLIYY